MIFLISVYSHASSLASFYCSAIIPIKNKSDKLILKEQYQCYDFLFEKYVHCNNNKKEKN